MQLTVHAFTTFDGVMQGPGGPDEDRTGGFPYGGWMPPFVDDDMGAIVDSWFARTDQILLGRTTYEAMAGFWSQVTDPDDPVSRTLNTSPKHVVSRTLGHAEWHNTSIIAGDLEQALRALKARDGGELQVHGSWQLVQALHELDLVDEYRVLVFPVTLGCGKRLFPDGARPTTLDVVESRTTGSGATHLVLRPSSAPQVGEFVVQDGSDTTVLA